MSATATAAGIQYRVLEPEEWPLLTAFVEANIQDGVKMLPPPELTTAVVAVDTESGEIAGCYLLSTFLRGDNVLIGERWRGCGLVSFGEMVRVGHAELTDAFGEGCGYSYFAFSPDTDERQRRMEELGFKRMPWRVYLKEV